MMGLLVARIRPHGPRLLPELLHQFRQVHLEPRRQLLPFQDVYIEYLYVPHQFEVVFPDAKEPRNLFLRLVDRTGQAFTHVQQRLVVDLVLAQNRIHLQLFPEHLGHSLGQTFHPGLEVENARQVESRHERLLSFAVCVEHEALREADKVFHLHQSQRVHLSLLLNRIDERVTQQKNGYWV